MNTVRKGVVRHPLIAGLLLVVILSSLPSASALGQETISRRDLVIDLGDGLTTAAQLTYPSVGEGPFPGVLLIPGGGVPDMDEYMPAYAAETGEVARPFLQIAEYLSERGFAVFRSTRGGSASTAPSQIRLSFSIPRFRTWSGTPRGPSRP